MSLSSIVSERIEQDLSHIEALHQEDLHQSQRSLQKRLSSLERTYTQEVEQAIASQKNLRKFLIHQDEAFKAGETLHESLDQVYRDALPEILETSYAIACLRKFFAAVESTTEIEVSGERSSLLKDIVSKYSPKASLKTRSSEGTGSITYTIGNTVWELSLSDFIQDVKKRTISDVLALM